METKTRVLTADANLDFCKMLEKMAAAENDMEVVGKAADGMEALAKIAELRPDIVLLDLVLPKLDGLEVLHRLPETGCRPHVIVLSGFVNSGVVSACSAAGADYFIPKPCDAPMLLGRIRRGKFPAEGFFQGTVVSLCDSIVLGKHRCNGLQSLEFFQGFLGVFQPLLHDVLHSGIVGLFVGSLNQFLEFLRGRFGGFGLRLGVGLGYARLRTGIFREKLPVQGVT